MIETLNKLKQAAKQYRLGASESINRNSHMNNIQGDVFIKQNHIDAILVDFINYIASKYNIDYALYTEDICQTEEPTERELMEMSNQHVTIFKDSEGRVYEQDMRALPGNQIRRIR